MNIRLIKAIAFLLFFLLITKTDIQAQSNFPVSWLGCYEGEMYLADQKGINDTVQVQFDFLKTATPNRWTYRMTYNSKKWGRMVKDYEMTWNDSLKNPNLFLLDEKDGIFIQELFLNDRFYSHFEVEENHFLALLERKGKNLYFEIRCTDPKQGMKSTSKADPNGVSYQVANYLQYSLQYVLLKPGKTKRK